MSTRTIAMTDQIQEYLLASTVREPEVFRRLREETARMPNDNLQIAPEQGQLMALLAESIGARRALEIGTFTGYSALWVASVLPEDGKLIACDVSEEWTQVARRYWQEAGLAHKIDLRLGPAIETLDALSRDGLDAPIDFAFIDADKTGYDAYYERVLTMLRPGGLIAFDNALQHGRVADPNAQDENTKAIRALNAKIHGDERVTCSLVPIADGLLLARKRS